MSSICTNCGGSLQKGAKYCLECGKPVATESKEEKRPKFILSPTQRIIFLHKILPTIVTGSIIWLFSEIFFSFIFIDLQFNNIFLIFYIGILIIELFLLTALYFISKSNKSILSLIVFFIFSFGAGILSLPIIMITDFLPQVHMFVSLSLGAILITIFIGLILKEHYFAEGYAWAHVFLFIIGTILLEIFFIMIFNIHNFLLTIPVSLAYILIVSLTTMFYGSKLVQKNEKEPWILKFFKLEIILLVSLILAIVIVVVVLIVIIIAILLEDFDIDLSFLSPFGRFNQTGSRSTRKKKRKQ